MTTLASFDAAGMFPAHLCHRDVEMRHLRDRRRSARARYSLPALFAKDAFAADGRPAILTPNPYGKKKIDMKVFVRLAVIVSVLVGLVQLSTAAHAHEAGDLPSEQAVSALSTAPTMLVSGCPGFSDRSGAADVQVHCSGVFLTGDAADIWVPAGLASRQPDPADSDVAAVPLRPDPPPPRV